MKLVQTFSSNVSNRRRRRSQKAVHLPSSIYRSHFHTIERQKCDDNLFGIMAIDTEYQTPDRALSDQEVKSGLGKVEVLSYQYCCYVYDEDDPEIEVWSGVVYPHDGERLDFSNIFVTAMSDARSKGYCYKLPLNWIVGGHFNRADFPVFADFQNINQSVNAVRGTFTSVGKAMPAQIKFQFDGGLLPIKISFRDTLLLAPTGQQSLGAIGDMLGMPKVKLSDDPIDDIALKIDMKRLLREDPVGFEIYAEADAIITAAYMDRMLRETAAITGKMSLPVTLTGTAVTLFDQKLAEVGKSRLAILGKEEVIDTTWYSSQGGFRSKTKEVFTAEVNLYIDFATEAYHGGRNEQFWYGPSHRAGWTDFDLAGAYPTAMTVLKTPDWSKIKHTTDIGDYTSGALGVAMVDFEFPETVRFPTMPVRTPHGLIFPRTGTSFCAAPEIALAKSLGAILTIKQGIIVPFADDEPVFGSFIKYCVDMRNSYPKGTLMNLLWKEFANATYGKLAQGLREKRVFDNRDGDTKPLPPSRITQPFFAAFTTSFVRAALGEIMNRLPDTACVHSVTTDGFLTDATDAEVDAATKGPICTTFGQCRAYLTGEHQVVERKHEVRRLLGWRTRGQATLEPGTTSNGDEYNTVLAKAGIYTSRALQTVRERNSYIVELFFKRTFDQRIEVFLKTGMRDIVLEGADLVEKYRFKQLGMDFDFKRRPFSVVTGDGFDHISFSTTPWDSVAQFLAIREHFQAFRKSTERCLKDTSDFEAFATYLVMKTSLDGKLGTYLRSKEGDIKRLRGCLAGAWKKSLGGLVFQEPVKTAAEFADLLSECGVPCKRADVENAAKKAFIGKACPPTPAVLEALARVQLVIPTLDPAVFLADQGAAGAINVLDALSRSDAFTQKLLEQIDLPKDPTLH